MNKAKSFVSYSLLGNQAFLGQNPFIALTEGAVRRICQNCMNCNKLIGPTETVCGNQQAKKAFKAGEGVIMAKTLDGQPVGNFCQFFELVKNNTNSNNTGGPEFSAADTTEEQPKVLFVAPATGKFYYPADATLPKNVNQQTLRMFYSLDEALAAGLQPKF